MCTNLIRPTVTGSYTWNIPELSLSQTRQLCCGYIRIEFSRVYHIPKDIVDLCTSYFNALDTVSKRGKGTLQTYNSKIFDLDSIKFTMLFQTDSYSSIIWKVFVPYLPPNVASIDLYCKMEIIGTPFHQTQHYILYGAVMKMVYDTNIHSIDFDHIQLKLTIFDMKQYDAKHNIILPFKPYQIMRNINHRSSGFVWRVTDPIIINKLQNASAGVYINSPLFVSEAFKWMIKISFYDDKDADVCVYLASLSPKIKRLCIAYTLCFEEIDKYCQGTHSFGDAQDENISRSMSLWKIEFFKRKDIGDIQRITMKMEICILDIFYADEDDMCNVHEEHQCLNTINGEYQWKVEDETSINNMKTARNGEDFISPFFEINVFKWCLKAYPNGYDGGNQSKMNTFLRLVSYPPNIGQIAVQYQLCLHETKSKFTAIERFSNESASFGWTVNLLSITEVQDIPQFTFTVHIKIIDIFDCDANIITDSFIDKDVFDEMKVCKHYMSKPCDYKWMIDDKDTVQQIKKATNGFNFLSEMFSMFGLKWYLEFIPVPCDHDPEFDGDDQEFKNDYSVLYFCCAAISPNIKNIRINYTLSLKETNTVYTNCTELDGCYSTGWSRNTLKRTEIDDIQTFTFVVTVNFIDIYDLKGNNLTDEYVNGSNWNSMINEDKKRNELLTDRFEWNIDDELMMNKIKNANNSEFMISNMFVMHGFKWKMKIYPNGTKPQRIGIFNWYFNLISIPPNISKVSLFYKIIETESNSMDFDKTSMRCRSSQFGWGQNKLKLRDVIHLKRLSFVLEIKIIDVFDDCGNRLKIDEYKEMDYKLNDDEIHYKLNEFEWKYNNMKMAKIGEAFESQYHEMDGFNWFLRLIPNGMNKDEFGETKLFICIKSLQKDVKSVSFYFELNIVETALSYSNYGHFRKEMLCKTWLTSQVKMEQLQNLNQVTCKAKIKIVDIYR